MNAKELRLRSDDDLKSLVKTLEGELFDRRMQNFTNQLDDTSLLAKKRRVLARIFTELRARATSAPG